MPRKDKLSVDIRNRPSERNHHSTGEWVEHIQLTETHETRRDIRDARAKLGKLTVRAFAETFCYDDRQVADYIVAQLGEDTVIGEMTVDPRALRKLADRVGGKKAQEIVANSTLREIRDEPAVETSEQNTKSDQQVELLRALLKTMDPDVVKRALTGG